MAKDPSEVARIKGSAAEQRALAKEDAAQRKVAKHILTPGEVRGKYDAERMLKTTLGGVKRPITHADLAAFQRNAKVAGDKYAGGITVRGVIDLSRAIDRKRARQEITMAVPTMANTLKRGDQADGLQVRFITNSGPESDVSRHHCIVVFNGYSDAIIRGDPSHAKAAAQMRKMPIRIECDCGRFRYWFRYIASIGKFNAGRAETGYPKIRNPELTGVACKHLLRVMAEIEGSSTVQRFLTRAIEKGRATEDGNARIQQSAKEAKALAEKQAARPTPRRASGDRDFDRAARALRQQSRSRRPPPPKRVAPGSRRAQQLRDQQAVAALTALAAQFGMTPEQAAKKMLGGK